MTVNNQIPEQETNSPQHEKMEGVFISSRIQISEKLGKLWIPGEFIPLEPMTFENYEENSRRLFEAKGLVPDIYEDQETGFRGWEFDTHTENKRGTIVIPMGWRAPEWYTADLVKILNDNGYKVMVSGLPGYGINYKGSEVDPNEDILAKYGYFLSNYRNKIIEEDGEDLPIIQMPVSLSARAIYKYMADEKHPSIGDAVYAIAPASSQKSANDFLINSILKRYFGPKGKNLLRERIFFELERLSSKLPDYPYGDFATINHEAARLLGEEAAIPLGYTMSEFYVRPGDPNNNLAKLIKEGMLLGAISGLADELCDVLRTMDSMQGKLAIILGAPHSIFTESRPGAEETWLMEEVARVLEVIVKYSEQDFPHQDRK